MSKPDPDFGQPLETPEQERFHKRIGSRLVVGAAVGLMSGLILGAAVGLWWFDRVSAVAASAIAGSIFGLAVGMLVAGYSALESPDPGKEPSDTERPIVDRPEATREEHDDQV